jgi:predicted metal-dependent HD superfamily phosphohydrolase
MIDRRCTYVDQMLSIALPVTAYRQYDHDVRTQTLTLSLHDEWREGRKKVLRMGRRSEISGMKKDLEADL